MNISNVFKSNIPVAIWTFFILILSFIKLPPSAGEDLIPHADKIVHFTLYLILGFLLIKKPWKPLHGILYGLLLGGLIEIIQGFTNYRSADIYDFCCDALGLLAGLYHNKLFNIFK